MDLVGFFFLDGLCVETPFFGRFCMVSSLSPELYLLILGPDGRKDGSIRDLVESCQLKCGNLRCASFQVQAL